VLPDGPHAGEVSKATLFPFTMDGQRLGLRLDPPTLGNATEGLLDELGYDPELVQLLRAKACVR
jgi:crotonobetainyl-CoA:carnitine CoA-transferase CaiB-like acyl-CoA transferase